MTEQDRYHMRMYLQSRWEDRHPDLKPLKTDWYTPFILVCFLITIVANVLTIIALR